jgi:hypothetical protein
MANQTTLGKENGATFQRTTAESAKTMKCEGAPHFQFRPDTLHRER